MSEAVDTVEKKETGNSTGIVQYTSDVKEELTRVSFPSWEDVRNITFIVVLNVIFFAFFLFFVDQAWIYILAGIEWLINKATGL